MTAIEMMSTPVVSVRPDTPLDDAAHLFVRHGFSTMPVIDDDNHLVGLVTESDVFRALAMRIGIGLSPTAHLDPIQISQRVRDITHRSTASVKPDDSVSRCLLLMVDHNGQSLPVVQQGKVIGIISRSDALQALTGEHALDLREPNPNLPTVQPIDLLSTPSEPVRS